MQIRGTKSMLSVHGRSLVGTGNYRIHCIRVLTLNLRCWQKRDFQVIFVSRAQQVVTKSPGTICTKINAIESWAMWSCDDGHVSFPRIKNEKWQKKILCKWLFVVNGQIRWNHTSRHKKIFSEVLSICLSGKDVMIFSKNYIACAELF